MEVSQSVCNLVQLAKGSNYSQAIPNRGTLPVPFSVVGPCRLLEREILHTLAFVSRLAVALHLRPVLLSGLLFGLNLTFLVVVALECSTFVFVFPWWCKLPDGLDCRASAALHLSGSHHSRHSRRHSVHKQ